MCGPPAGPDIIYYLGLLLALNCSENAVIFGPVQRRYNAGETL